MTLECMAAQVVHRVNPNGSHVTYDQLRKFLTQNYDRDSKYEYFLKTWFWLDQF